MNFCGFSMWFFVGFEKIPQITGLFLEMSGGKLK